MNVQEKTMRFSVLDPLRLIAALAVVLYHYSIYMAETPNFYVSLMRFGYLGVDFFFVLSGFVIMASAQNRSAVEFAFARALRLYPAFIACLLFTAFICYWLSPFPLSAKEILINATILNDYVGIANVDGVYWTLQAELKFYGCVFALIWLGVFQYWRYWLTAWLSLAVIYFFCKQPFFMGWFINPSYSFYFIGGVCSYLLYRHQNDRHLQLLFSLNLVFAFFTAKYQMVDFIPRPSAMDAYVSGVAAVCFLVFFYLLGRGYFNVKSSMCLSLLGAISYPLYLIHNRAGKTIIDNLLSEFNIYFLLLLVIVCLSGFSLLVHLYIEKKLTLMVKKIGILKR